MFNRLKTRLINNPRLVQIIYFLGACALTVLSLVLFMRNSFWIGILSIIVGNLFWRLICNVILFFLMHDQLDLIRQKLEERDSKT